MPMLRRGTRRGWVRIAGVCAALGAFVVAGMAFAAQQPVVAADGAGNSYSQPNYTMDQGEQLQFQNVGPGNQHDVFSRLSGPDGKKLFISSTINPGTNATVRGTEYLTAGTYAFFCNVHPFEMTANLNVTGNGTPVARPDIEVKIGKAKLDTVASKGKVPVVVTALTQSNGLSMTLKLGKLTLGTQQAFNLAAGRTQKVVMGVNKKGKAKLADRNSAKLKVTAEVPFGSPDTAKKTIK